MTQNCSECKAELSQFEDWHNGDLICKQCGLVAPERLIDAEHEEKRTFNADRSTSGRKEDNSRTARLQPNTNSLSTAISFDNNPNSSTSDASKALSGLQNSLISYKDQKLNSGTQDINSICETLKLNEKVKSRATEIWREFEKARKKYSRAGDKNMYLAIVYTACKEENLGRSFKEIAEGSSGDIKQITRSYKRLVKLRQETTAPQPDAPAPPKPVDQQEEPEVKPKPSRQEKKNKGTTAVDMMPRIANKLKLPYNVCVKAGELAKRAAPFLEGKHPNTIAAASLLYYLKQSKEGNNSIYDKEVAKAAGVAPSTMRSAYRVLEDNRSALTDAV